jgi:hypothetical protein
MTQSEEEFVGQPIDDVPKRTPDEDCNARRSEDGTFVGYCSATAGKGTDHVGEGRCSHHGGKAPRGTDAPNYKHGAYSDHLRSDLTPAEQEAFEDLVASFEDPDETLDAIRELAAEVLLKYKRSADDRFLREFRQLADTFNLAPNADQLEVDADVDTNAGLDDETEVALREALRSRREDDT